MKAIAPPARRGRWLAGCFILFGFLCFLPLLWIAVGFSEFIAYDSKFFWNSLRWDSFPAFRDSLINSPALHPEMRFFAYSVAFIAVYALLLWQWMACFFRRRTFLRPRRLWAVTASYFVVFMAFLQIFFFMPLVDEIDTTVWWTWWSVVGCAFPLSFISMSVRLWKTTPD
jgi:hypothetical protein